MCERVLKDLAALQAPLPLGAAPDGATSAARTQNLAAAVAPFEGDVIPQEMIYAIARADRAARLDSLHIVIMDLHRAINKLQETLAEQNLDGARVWNLQSQLSITSSMSIRLSFESP